MSIPEVWNLVMKDVTLDTLASVVAFVVEVKLFQTLVIRFHHDRAYTACSVGAMMRH